ncbi:MAG: hypothetical protein ABC585_05740 [Candidatus Methanosuratincola petrocarbonis]
MRVLLTIRDLGPIRDEEYAARAVEQAVRERFPSFIVKAEVA